MKDFSVKVTITEGLIAFTVKAETPEDALKYGREKLKKINLFSRDVEVIDSTEEVTGVY